MGLGGVFVTIIAMVMETMEQVMARLLIFSRWLRFEIEDRRSKIGRAIFPSIGDYCRFIINIGTSIYSLILSLFVIGNIIT